MVDRTIFIVTTVIIAVAVVAVSIWLLVEFVFSSDDGSKPIFSYPNDVLITTIPTKPIPNGIFALKFKTLLPAKNTEPGPSEIINIPEKNVGVLSYVTGPNQTRVSFFKVVNGNTITYHNELGPNGSMKLTHSAQNYSTQTIVHISTAEKNVTESPITIKTYELTVDKEFKALPNGDLSGLHVFCYYQFSDVQYLVTTVIDNSLINIFSLSSDKSWKWEQTIMVNQDSNSDAINNICVDPIKGTMVIAYKNLGLKKMFFVTYEYNELVGIWGKGQYREASYVNETSYAYLGSKIWIHVGGLGKRMVTLAADAGSPSGNMDLWKLDETGGWINSDNIKFPSASPFDLYALPDLRMVCMSIVGPKLNETRVYRTDPIDFTFIEGSPGDLGGNPSKFPLEEQSGVLNYTSTGNVVLLTNSTNKEISWYELEVIE